MTITVNDVIMLDWRGFRGRGCTAMTRARDSDDQQYLDLLIVGAGLSGIGAAYRIIQRNPALSYRIADRRAPRVDATRSSLLDHIRFGAPRAGREWAT